MKSYPVERCVAELFGTFLLTFAVLVSLRVGFAVPTVIVAALTLGTIVYMVGSISGAHVNPAITIGLHSIGKINLRDTVLYIVFQVIGAVIAMMLLQNITAVDLLRAENSVMAAVCELLGAFVFGTGVAAVAFGRVHEAASGLAVGSSLFLGLVVASSGSLAILNPAVAIGLGAMSLVYLLAPIAGTVCGMQFYRWLIGSKK